MGTVNQRIAQIQIDSGLSVRKFAERIGIAQPSAKAIIDGSNAPSWKAIQGIAIGFPNISLEWLVRDKGQMLLSEDVSGYTEGMARLPQKDAEEIAKLLHGHRAARYDIVAEDSIQETADEKLQRLIDERIEKKLNEKMKRI